MDEGLLWIMVAVAVNGIIDCTVVAWLAGRRSKDAIFKVIEDAAKGDKKAQEMFFLLADLFIVWASSRQIPTGKKIKAKNDAGDVVETEELVTPMHLIGRSVGDILLMKIKAMRGGTATQVGAELNDAAGLASLIGGRRKDQSGMDYAIEQATLRYAPQIDQIVTKKLKDLGLISE